MTALGQARIAALFCIVFSFAEPAVAQERFRLTSPEIMDGGALPADLKCSRDGGDGVSPPLAWANAPAGTQGFAVIMQHYPRGKAEGVDVPSQYWLLWNIPATASGLERGNPASVGDEGADKDMRRTGYTPPCSPAGSGTHTYTITVYALKGLLTTLPPHDDGSVDWRQMTAALEGHVLAKTTFSFVN